MKWSKRRRFVNFLTLFGALTVGMMSANTWLKAQEEDTATVVAEEVAVEVEAPAEAEAEAAPAKPFGELTLEEKVDKLAESSLKMDDAGNISSTIYSDADILWTCIAAFLVFFMQAGFALVEAGFTRAKNTCNILMKNLMDFVLGSIIFWVFGFGLMFSASNGYFGTGEFFFDATKHAVDKGVNFGWAFLLFQTVFCATAATIVSGAMAERTKFSSYLLYTVGITAIVYPVFGSWAWGSLWHGGNWLSDAGFLDYAGSTVVHSIGGWAALAGAITVGPRIGKFVKGKPVAIPGHNIPMATLGVFILWLGWFGFNPGSTTAVGNGNFAYLAVTTNIAACGGALSALITAWIMFKKPDVSFTLNGALAGLVAITAGCDVIPVPYALLTGLLAGVLVVASCVFFDRIRIDDPVGAISVHGVCGALGTICTGLFAAEKGLFLGGGADQLIVQLKGVGAAFLWSFGVSMLIFQVIKYTVGIRVSEVEEFDGLDMHEHGMSAYPAGWVAVADQTMGLPPTSPGSHQGGMSVAVGAPQTAN